MTRNEEERHAENVAERNRLGKALTALGNEAQCVAHERDPDYVWARLERRGTTRTRAEVVAIFAAYDSAPHCHAVLTLHTFGGLCALGNQHRGCCPDTKGCDHPGWYPRAS